MEKRGKRKKKKTETDGQKYKCGKTDGKKELKGGEEMEGWVEKVKGGGLEVQQHFPSFNSSTPMYLGFNDSMMRSDNRHTMMSLGLKNLQLPEKMSCMKMTCSAICLKNKMMVMEQCLSSAHEQSVRLHFQRTPPFLMTLLASRLRDRQTCRISATQAQPAPLIFVPSTFPSPVIFPPFTASPQILCLNPTITNFP
ncbi:hypothetical protein FQA47_000116 [Oryzias melastigma]|uniref:Uncharacterized protein n=1 Tax=Oryzias melastigma TaxID=30732 RepID=A0A834BTF4_ORYME|nr:hypothetical protein FQA47_000116 [Oryzias melastigma]